jgi:hypothetical protein
MQRLLAFALMGPLLVSGPFDRARSASLDGLAVEVKNESEPVLCPEKDNVAIVFTNKDVRSFRIEAMHPVYLSSGLRDDWISDMTTCDMTADPVHAVTMPPRKVTLYESPSTKTPNLAEPDLWIIGYTYSTFWRPATATVRVGERVEKNLHLLQIWLRTDVAEEVLVLYPQDGYWRARPLSPLGFRKTGYGSSFLVGPVEVEGRPIVKLKEVAFEPKTKIFTLDFEHGGKGTLRMVSIDQEKITLDVAFEGAIDGGPFAMLRSMYVTEFNNDVAHIAVREKGAKGWREENIMKFDRAAATDVWMGRLSASMHNMSAPDFLFKSFSGGPQPKWPKNEPPARP